MKNKTLFMMGLGFSSLSLGMFPQVFAILAFAISIMLLSRGYDGPGLYLLVSSIVCGFLGTIFGVAMMVEVSICAMFVAAVINTLILLCMKPMEE